MTHDPYWQPADKLRFKTKLDEVRRLGMGQHFFRSFQRPFLRRKPYGSFAQPLPDDLFQTTESPAYNKENMLGVNRRRWFAPPLCKIHHGLNLTGNVIRRARGDLRLFH